MAMASLCLSSTFSPSSSSFKHLPTFININYPSSTKFNPIIASRNSLAFHPLALGCSVKLSPRVSTFVVRASSSSPTSPSDKTNEPLWKSFGKSIENFGKKPSVEDLLREQIEKQEYYDEGGGGGNRGGGRGGGGGGDGLGGSEDDGFSGILDETIQVILATLGFIFMYVYIINGAEMTRLAKDYISYLFGGRKSNRLTRALYLWGRFCKNLTEKPETDRFWLEKAIINTPTWWDSPEKYLSLLKAASPVQPKSDANDDNDETTDEFGSQADEEMSDDYY